MVELDELLLSVDLMFDVCVIAGSGDKWADQWSYVLSHWKPRRVYLIGDADRRLKPFRNVIEIESANGLPDLPLVVMQPESSRYIKPTLMISEFIHPNEVIYLFGSDHLHLTEDHIGGREAQIVAIPTDSHDEMYSWIACAVTLFDRASRHG